MSETAIKNIEKIEVDPETAEERHYIFESKVRKLVEKVRPHNQGVIIQKLDNLIVLGETGKELEVDVAYSIKYVRPDLLERRLIEEFRKFSIRGYKGTYTYVPLHMHTDSDSTKYTSSEMIIMLVKNDKEMNDEDICTSVSDCKEESKQFLEGLKEINLNSRIKVKLTNKGISIWANYIRDTDGEKYGIRPEMDAEGYSKFTLWEFMRIFGNSMFCGSDLICYPNSIFV